jgi:general secretion pathway protein I
LKALAPLAPSTASRSPSPSARAAREESRGAPASAQSGFTLIEVLVALTILSISMAVLLSIFLQGLDRARESSNEASARVLAQSLVTQAKAARNLAFGTSTGKTNGFLWRTRIVPYGSPADRAAWQTSPAQIVATVSWRGDGGERSVSLSTLKLLPKNGSGADSDDDDQ